jgi:hypothetical protein
MRNDVGIGSIYERYRELSQPVHGTMHATGLYRRNLGTEMVLGEFGGLIDWIVPMRLSWVGLHNLQNMVLFRCGPEPVEAPDEAFRESEIDEMFTEMARRAYELLPKERKG